MTKTSNVYVALLWNYLFWEQRCVDTDSHISEEAQKTWQNLY